HIFLYIAPATTDTYTLSLTTLFRSVLHPCLAEACFFYPGRAVCACVIKAAGQLNQHIETHQKAKGVQSALVVDQRFEDNQRASRSEEHTSELQSRGHLVCRLLLEKK